MDNICSCGGALSTSQVIIPIKRDGTIWYQTQRRCTACFKSVIIQESMTPPFNEGD